MDSQVQNERARAVVSRAAELLHTQPLPPLPAADVGAIPEAFNGCADTCAAYESDDVHEVSSS